MPFRIVPPAVTAWWSSIELSQPLREMRHNITTKLHRLRERCREMTMDMHRTLEMFREMEAEDLLLNLLEGMFLGVVTLLDFVLPNEINLKLVEKLHFILAESIVVIGTFVRFFAYVVSRHLSWATTTKECW